MLSGEPLAPLGPFVVNGFFAVICAGPELAGMDVCAGIDSADAEADGAGEEVLCPVGGALGHLAAVVLCKADNGVVSSSTPFGLWMPEGFTSGIFGGKDPSDLLLRLLLDRFAADAGLSSVPGLFNSLPLLDDDSNGFELEDTSIAPN